MDEDEVNQAAQSAIIKACDMCRKKKIRCEPTQEGCAQCTKYNTHCHFTPIVRRKKPRKPAGYKYISELQDRIQKMEGLLAHALEKKPESGSDSSPGEHDPFEKLNAEARVGSELGPRKATLDSPERDANLVDNNLIAVSSDGALAQSQGHTFDGMDLVPDLWLTPLQPPLTWRASLAPGPLSLPSFHKLPSKAVALELVEDTFQSSNAFLPIFDEQNFMRQFQEKYLDSSPSDPSWWACINVVLSMAHRFRAMRALETQYENAQSCGYINNALAVVSELNTLCYDLSAVQALVGMATILQGTPNPQPAAVLISSAVRLAQTMGLHRRIPDTAGLTEAQVEERKRVFWSAYYLDKDISIRTGLPSTQDDDDMDAELPAEDNLSAFRVGSYGLEPINFFNSRIGLAVIQGQIYKKLYSVQASRQSPAQRAALADELNSIVSYWRNNVPIDFEDNATVPLQPPLPIELTYLTVLRFAYINCLVMIDRHLPPPQQSSVLLGGETQGEVIWPESICIIEARKAVNLIQITPFGSYACIWLLLHPFFGAVTVLLQNVLRFPSSLQAPSDIRSTEPFLQLLETLAGESAVCSQSDEVTKMHHACNKLYLAAKEVVERASARIGFDGLFYEANYGN